MNMNGREQFDRTRHRILAHGKGFIEAVQDMIGNELWEAAGYTSYDNWLDNDPDMDRMMKEVNRVIPVRHAVVRRLTQEGKTQRHIAQRLGVSAQRVSKDQEALGVVPKGARYRPKSSHARNITKSDVSNAIRLPTSAEQKAAEALAAETFDESVDANTLERMIRAMAAITRATQFAIGVAPYCTSDIRVLLKDRIEGDFFEFNRRALDELEQLVNIPPVDWDRLAQEL